MNRLRRILDANANRAREAARVMEECARFLLDDAPLAARLKSLRHDLVAAVAAFGPLHGERDVAADVGREIATPSEGRRADAGAVAAAAAARLSEALRALEEFGKVVDPAAAARIEALRYECYALDAALRTRLARRAPQGWRLCVLVGRDSCGDRPPEAVAEAAIDGGADAIQLRERGMPDRALVALAERLRRVTEGRAALVVNDRPDVALAVGADGVHLGQDDLPAQTVRRMAGDALVVGVSTSRLEQAEGALAAGADYCGVGPMFPSSTKRKDEIVGPAYLRAFVAWGGLPHLAIGGVTAETIPALRAAGVRGVAVGAAVGRADDPAVAARAIRAALAASPAEATA